MATNQYLLPPKKPVNTFFHFQRDKMLEMLHANPEKKPSEVMPLLSEAYKNLSKTEKKKYEDLAAADRERYLKECQKYSKMYKIPAPKRLNSLPTGDDDDEEFKENPPKKMKGNKAKDNKKDNKKGTKKVTNDRENNMIFEDAAGSRPGPNPNNPNVRRNSRNQICFVRIDELTGKEILVPGVYILNEMVDSIPGSALSPEIWHRIAAARQKDKETVENAKRANTFDLIWE